jgi:hypothetical protein
MLRAFVVIVGLLLVDIAFIALLAWAVIHVVLAALGK